MVQNPTEVLYDNQTLYAADITLRRFAKTDVPDILAYGSDSATLEYLDWEGVTTLQQATDSLVNYYWSQPGIFAIALATTDQCIGCLDLRVDTAHHKSGFGYVLSRNHWGKGYMTQALRAALDLCFDKLQLNRVEGLHYVGNEASGRVMEKCGMVREGVARQQFLVKGIFRDGVHYGITRDMWEAGRA